ncbi:YcgN family cysteine cluster protein [Rhodobacter sp. NTK016B]|uniref:YcgN family cysteine cluster protein n=1 Tax=Rhodobacter sp. NTK016B TaxID=2759676 RepID=UPI001A8D9613|nr:YcgN family cysteine cluster protein [Rhodobacter sp. NTK016B]MBN8291391.1 YcgN family cysteine cluster protein [Rhodobacter sp. NTK016B]
MTKAPSSTVPARPDAPRPRFWETVPLSKMTPTEWESLCDGCGKCCLNKLEDADTGEVFFTNIACRLFDDSTCRCANYEIRKTIVPECVVLTPDTLDEVTYWMPRSCAYRRLNEGRGLADWHPLITGDPQSAHRAGISVRDRTVPEFDVPEDDWEDHIIDEEL